MDYSFIKVMACGQLSLDILNHSDLFSQLQHLKQRVNRDLNPTQLLECRSKIKLIIFRRFNVSFVINNFLYL